MSSTTISPIDTPMYSAFKAIISDLKSTSHIQSSLQQLVMMRFNLTMAKDSGLKDLLMNLPTTEDLDQLKSMVIGKIECMEYVEVKKKMMEDYAAECMDTTKSKKRPATSDLDTVEPVAKRPCPSVAPPRKIDEDFFSRKRTAPVKFVRKPKAPVPTTAVPIYTATTSAVARFQSTTTNSLELMKKCRDIRQAKEAKEKMLNEKKVQSTKSVLETYREQRIKEQQNRNNGIVPKIDTKKVNRKFL